ncbi:ABC transporter substrate-binding protein [soil metagenome]
MIELKGMSWNHTRGFVSVVATAQRFEELNPHVRIRWEKRSLQDFADVPLGTLAQDFDLIMMDHPHTAEAAEDQVLLAYGDYLPKEFLQDQADNSVGRSHESYQHLERQWTLATDAAAPIATWRPDLMDRHDLTLPQTWEDVLALARCGHVVAALFPVDVLMHVYMFCEALGDAAFKSDEIVAGKETLHGALECLRELAAHCSQDCLQRNPILTAEFMTRTDEAAYCPFAFGYSNYSRPGYASKPLRAGNLITLGGRRLRSTLGGAGLAVSARTKHPAACMDYAAFTASAEMQRGLYFQAGGQPGHRSAWVSEEVNAASCGFFRETLNTLDQALLRPRYHGYMYFQDMASPVAHQYVSGLASLQETREKLNQIYRKSRSKSSLIIPHALI